MSGISSDPVHFASSMHKLAVSDTNGHAMKVADYPRAQGAIIGKAMTSLKDGRGLVLVLVSLQ